MLEKKQQHKKRQTNWKTYSEWNGSTEHEIEKVKQTRQRWMTSMQSRSLSTWLPLETLPWRKTALPEHSHFSKYSKIILFCVLILKSDHKFSCWVSLLLHLSVDRNLGDLHVLATVDSVAVSCGVHVSFQIMVFSECTHVSGITGSYGSSVYSFLRNLNIRLYHGCTHLHSHR